MAGWLQICVLAMGMCIAVVNVVLYSYAYVLYVYYSACDA